MHEHKIEWTKGRVNVEAFCIPSFIVLHSKVNYLTSTAVLSHWPILAAAGQTDTIIFFQVFFLFKEMMRTNSSAWFVSLS